MRFVLFVAAVSAVLAGCTTQEETRAALSSRWIGQSSDSFFAQHGPPVSQFALTSGGTVYTWTGGQTTRTIAPTFRPMTDAEKAAQQNAPRTVINIGTTAAPNQPYVPPGQVMVSPGRTEQLGCELTISTDAGGTITNITPQRDTDGEGLSFSRCGEVFGVKS